MKIMSKISTRKMGIESAGEYLENRNKAIHAVKTSC
jgi:hypothetical protein